MVPIVLSINQLVRSREFKPPGEVREGIQVTISYRDEVAGTTGEDLVPTTPNEFLNVLLRATRFHARRLGASVEDTVDEERAADVESLVPTIS